MLWVGRDGEVHISRWASRPEMGSETESSVAFRLGSFADGNGYVGPTAVNDEGWVRGVFDVLVKTWGSRHDWSRGPSLFVDDY